MWDTEYNDDSRYAYSVDMGDGGSPLVDSGTKSQEGSSAPFAGWVAQGFANSIAYYGAWYEGEQQNDYYNKKVELTWREKQQYLRSMERRIAFTRMEAVDAQREALTAERINEIRQSRYQEDSDSGISAVVVAAASSGVDISSGSPLEVMGKAIDDRAQEFALLQWGGEREVYAKERRAASIFDKATIMLDEMKMGLQDYDYQAALYGRAAGDARRAARYKSYQAAFNI